MGDATETFQQLNRVFADSGLRSDPRARPITFHVLDSDQDGRWTFDPHSKNSWLFAQGTHPAPALAIGCNIGLLEALLKDEPLDITPNTPLEVSGDASALDPLTDALARGRSPLSLRAEIAGEQR